MFKTITSVTNDIKLMVNVLLRVPGCKIKALRAKTNTYIKTPVRGEEPVFIVTGRKEDVEMAKREIVSAAEHFSMIRASRCKAGGPGGGSLPGPPHLPGQTTIQVQKSPCL